MDRKDPAARRAREGFLAGRAASTSPEGTSKLGAGGEEKGGKHHPALWQTAWAGCAASGGGPDWKNGPVGPLRAVFFGPGLTRASPRGFLNIGKLHPLEILI